MPTLAEQIDDYVRASNTALWIHSSEHEEALLELTALCSTNQWAMLTWDAADGLQLVNTGTPVTFTKPASVETMPMESFKVLEQIALVRSQAKNTPTQPSTLLILRNLHDRLGDNLVLKQNVIKAAYNGRRSRAFVVVLSPLVKIPPELEKLFTVVDHELPNVEQLKSIAKTLATEKDEYPTDAAEEKAVIDAAVGMSRIEAENAFSLSIIRHRKLVASEIWSEKSHALLKNGLLQLHRGGARFKDLGGMNAMKKFHRALLKNKNENPLAQPKGTLLLSPPGCGKSQFCKALGTETGRPVLSLDIGALMGGRVGQTESQTREALRTVDAMAPCILFIDEIEKAFSGASDRGVNDGGVSQRMMGSILTWMNDHTTEVFTIGTCNDISKILASNPEFARAERFDGIFYVDLPNVAERDKIWEIYLKMFGIDSKDNPRPDDTDWTGAEIKSCCRLATMLGYTLQQAGRLVVPISRTATAQIDALKEWAKGRCLSATSEGLYGEAVEAEVPNERPKRAISRVKG